MHATLAHLTFAELGAGAALFLAGGACGALLVLSLYRLARRR